MDKRDFLKASGALVAGGFLSRFSTGQQQPAPRHNWSGNITYSTDRVLAPASVEDVSDAVKSAARLRAVGSRHSFNTIADSNACQISLEHLDSIDIDDKAHTVTVGAGIR